MITGPLHRLFSHDELFTYYMAQAPTFSRLVEEIRNLDLNPPLVYLVTRWWQHLFGTGEVATRTPSAICFLLASLGFIRFLSRRVGILWGSAAVVLFWCSPYFQYATEIRPYALLLLGFSLALVSWDHAISHTRRALALAGLFAGIVIMMLSHVFGLFSVGALLLAELVRTARLRRVDWPIWAMLLLPLATGITYIPLMQRFEAGAFPLRYQGGPRKVAVFFAKAALGIATPVEVLCVAVLAAGWFHRSSAAERPAVHWEDWGLWIGMLLPVFLINIMLMRTHAAFFERYCVTSALAFAAACVLALGRLAGFRRVPGACALVVLLGTGLWLYFVPPAFGHQLRSDPGAFDALRPDLPFVASSGLTFLEMDHYEHPGFVSRLYYLTDRKAAIEYAHATIFEGMPFEKRYFPIRANVEPYAQFVAAHPHFLVLGTMDFPEDWLLRKLVKEGANVKPVARVTAVAYKDYDVYDVLIPPGSPALQP